MPTTNGKPEVIGSATPVASPLSDLPPPKTEGSTTIDPVASTSPTTAAMNTTIPPALPMPGANNALLPAGMPPLPGATNVTGTPASLAVPPANLFAGPGLGGPGLGAMGFPEIRVIREKEVKSWQTKLASTVRIPKTKFNYRREVLSEQVYRSEYNHDNAHLPRRMTREEYANMLFNSIARNDVETTRTILNEGTAVRVTTAFGETPLQYARRAGATEVAQLLIARGASY